MQSLGRVSRAEAERLKWPIIYAMREEIAGFEAVRLQNVATRQTKQLAEIDDYQKLVKALAARRREMGISQLACDDLAGFQSGYTGKLECGTKRLGDFSTAGLLRALKVKLVLKGEPVNPIRKRLR